MNYYTVKTYRPRHLNGRYPPSEREQNRTGAPVRTEASHASPSAEGASNASAALPMRPVAVPIRREGIPPTLSELPQWVTWGYVWVPETEKWTKVPHDPTSGYTASSTNPLTWGTLESAIAGYEIGHESGDVDGIGFVATTSDPYVGIDI